MELLLSSPVPVIAAIIFLPVVIGVFIYELRNERKKHEPPKANFVPPVVTLVSKPEPVTPTKPAPVNVNSIAPSAKKSKKKIAALMVMLFLVAGVFSTVYVLGQDQRLFNFAQTQPGPSPSLTSVQPTPTRSASAGFLTSSPSIPPVTQTPIKSGPTPTARPSSPTPTQKPVQKLPDTGGASISATPIVQPKTPQAGGVGLTLLAIFSGIILVGLSAFAFIL